MAADDDVVYARFRYASWAITDDVWARCNADDAHDANDVNNFWARTNANDVWTWDNAYS